MIIAKYNKGYKVIYESKCIRELWRKLEEMAIDYLLKLEVQDEKYFKKSKSRGWTSHPYGYFLVKGQDKLNIYHKYISKGYIYNSTVIEKLITFILVRPQKETEFIYLDDSEDYKLDSIIIDQFTLLKKELLQIKSDLNVIEPK